MSAARHWIALDEMVSRLLPRPVTLRARERFASRTAALTGIYVTRILNGIAPVAAGETDVAGRVRELLATHHALTDTLTRAWTTPDDRSLSSPDR